MALNFDDLPIRILEEVELATGSTIEELFKDDNKSPYRKRAIAYLSAKSQGNPITWAETGELTVSQLVALMGGDVDDPKDV